MDTQGRPAAGEGDAPAPGRGPRDGLRFGVIALAYLLLGLGYSLATPLGEGIDESTHLAYVQFLQEERRLPRPQDAVGLLTDQAKHPPLYYLAAAVLTWPADLGSLRWTPNPHCCNLERPSPAVTRHLEGDRFPYAQPYRRLRLLRLAGLLCGLALLWATWRAARLVAPGRPELATAATALAVFLPQFLFMQGVVNNDVLANALAALCLWAGLRVALGEARPADLLRLGVFLGLGLLTKLTLLAYLPFAALALLLAAERARSLAPLRRGLLWCALPCVALCGGWFAWNLVVKGDLLGWSSWMEVTGFLHRDRPLSQELPDYLAMQWRTFWGSFGWATVRLPEPLYRGLAAVTALGALGLARVAGRAWRQRPRKVAETAGAPSVSSVPSAPSAADPVRAALLLAAAGLLVYAAVFRLAFQFDLTVAQGRYLFVALPAAAIGLAGGLLGLAPRRWGPRLAGVIVVAALGLGVYGLWGVLWPAFRPPPALEAAELAALDPQSAAAFGPDIRLLSWRLPRAEVAPGQALPIELVWWNREWIDQGYLVFAQAYDGGGRLLGQLDAMPAGGLYPTVLWYPDRAWRDRLALPIAPDAPAGEASLILGLYLEGEPGARLPVRIGDRPPADHLAAGSFRVRGTAETAPSAVPRARRPTRPAGPARLGAHPRRRTR